jgi:hypothetical protein
LGVELGFSVRRLSRTLDEANHIQAGYRYWQCGDFGVNPEHPPLAKLVATIPLNFDRPKNHGLPCASYDTGKSPDNVNGIALLSSNDEGRILAETRTFAATFAILLAFFTFLAARSMFGTGAALTALLILVFEPNILANGALVTTDVAMTCWMLATVYALYRYLMKPSVLRLILCGFSLGLTLASKHSAVLLVPILVLIVLADLWLRRHENEKAGATGEKGSSLARFVIQRARVLLVVFAISIAVLWGFYLFRHSARPAGHAMTESLPDIIQRSIREGGINDSVSARVFPGLAKVLPEPYVYGLWDGTFQSRRGRPMYLLGEVHSSGKWYYFPTSLVIKTTLGFLLLLVLAIVAHQFLWREKLRETLFLLIPAAFYFAISLTSHLNLGIRHILPIFPFLIILAAAAAWHLAGRKPIWRYAVIFLLAIHCVSSMAAFPHYMAYSNEAWGGWRNTYRHLSNCDVDWAGGLLETKDYLIGNGITDCWIGPRLPADPRDFGIPCKVLPVSRYSRGVVIPPVIEGTLLVDASVLAGFEWGSRALNPYAPLWNEKPVTNIGGHTLVFQGRFTMPFLGALSHRTQSRGLFRKKQFEAALAEARTGMEMAPEMVDGHLQLAQTLVQLNRVQEARLEYREAIRLCEKYQLVQDLYSGRKALAALDSLH